MKIIKTLFVLIGLCAIGLCTAFAIKMPSSYKDLFNIVDKENATIQSIPYYVNFGDFDSSDSSYKSQYFEYDSRQWFLSWGNKGQKDNNMLLGWESKEQPIYGNYSAFNDVTKNMKIGKDSYYSFVIMNFDFDSNHLMEFILSSYDDLTNTESTLYLISSHNLGKTWSIKKQFNNTDLIKDKELKFTNTESNLFTKTTRYGLVLVSEESCARIELKQFVVGKLGV